MSLLDNFKVLTITHHNLNINEIGNFYIKPPHTSNKSLFLKALKDKFSFSEFIYLETCNRVSYIFYADLEIDEQFIAEFFNTVNSDLQKMPSDVLQNFITVFEGEKAIQHVFELASSMDSLVVGEREIFKQFRTAYNDCYKLGITGDFLRLLEQGTVTTAKSIYSQTKIGEKPLSIVSLAFKEMLKINASADQKILLVGAGETNTLVAKFLKKYQFNNVKIFNRSIDNAKTISKLLEGSQAYHLNDIENVESFDVLFICTSANQVVIDLPLYKKMIKSDNDQKILFDLSVPRNISKEVVDRCQVKYIDIEFLKSTAEENLKFRKKELIKARPIIKAQINSFRRSINRRQIEKAMSLLPTEISSIKQKALQQVYVDRIESLPQESKILIKEMMDYMEKKCVAAPMRLATEL